MAMYIKDKPIGAVYLGNKALQAIYRGATIVWENISWFWKGKQVWKGKEKW